MLVEALLATTNCPVKEPAVSGSNCSCSVRDWPGFRVAGSFALESEKPVPVTVAEFTVKALVPVDVTVTDCAIGVFRTSLPNEIDVALILICAPPLVVDGVKEIEKLFEIPLSFAVITAV